ncbi:MAG: transmembrane(s)proteins 21..43 [Microgenomates bacterium 39_7]|nr:MAG: transmembrane(s)proteins 21..43 [Microgenomates bacterium 39_7]
MLDVKNHELLMKRILLDIYKHPQLQSQLVFKGGTCLYYFYNLPRFSTDLDFSFHQEAEQENVDREAIAKIVADHLAIKSDEDKRFTWLWIGSYQEGKQKVKVEVNKRKFSDSYVEQELYGLTVRTLDLASMFSHKLCAITNRRMMVNRDLYDTWWFLRQATPIKSEIIQERTNLSIEEYLAKAKTYIEENVDQNNILQGLGEVLSQPQKDWVRDHLLDELLRELELRVELEAK